MPPDLPNEQELTLKKRARRRLVGAIALVLLMVVVLPQVLQDRAAMTQREAIKITMPNVVSNKNQVTVVDQSSVVLQGNPPLSESAPTVTTENVPPEANSNSEPTMESLIASKEAENNKTARASSAPKAEEKTLVKAPEIKIAEGTGKEVKQSEEKSITPEVKEVKVSPKHGESFTVQVGVYSSAVNVKRLQDQLKQAGFNSFTEKITTPKGESIYLKTGNFASRQEAANALGKLKEIGMSGFVVSNE